MNARHIRGRGRSNTHPSWRVQEKRLDDIRGVKRRGNTGPSTSNESARKSARISVAKRQESGVGAITSKHERCARDRHYSVTGVRPDWSDKRIRRPCSFVTDNCESVQTPEIISPLIPSG